MPAGRSTFNKRQKEQARQQKQRDKAERKNQRRQDGPTDNMDELAEMRRHAEEQAALFNVGLNDAGQSE